LRRAALALVAAVLYAAARSAAQETAAGVVVTFAAGERSDTRTARIVALHVPAGEAASPFVAAGPFLAVFRGVITVGLRDRYTFAVEGTGAHELRIGGDVVAVGKPVRLGKGGNPFELRYRAPESGPATLRLLWSGSGFAPEAVPPDVLSHDPAPHADALERGRVLRRGRELIAERQCSRCHAASEAWRGAQAMPELQRDAPDLRAAGERLQPGWVARWLLDPHAHRGRATMPRLLHGEGAAQDARDIAAWLAQLGAPQPPPAAGRATEGGALFHDLGCIGCHTLPGASPRDPQRIPLGDVPAKWQPAALVAFLRAPARHHAWSTMPDFGLEESEALALAAFLRALPGARFDAAPGDAARGRERAAASGCAACHALPVDNALVAAPLTDLGDWTAGCVADEPGPRAPDFGFDAPDRAALRAVAAHLDSLGRRSLTEFAIRQRAALRCDACHAFDGRPERLVALAAEVADLAPAPDENAPHTAAIQTRPELTLAGEKLRTGYLAALLSGNAPRARPWLRSRMPAFGARAELLAQGLAAEHGFAAAEPPDATFDPALAAIGGRLVPGGEGFACNLCHGIGAQPPMQVFEEQGVNLALVAARLRKSFYHRWMADPQRLRPSTRMPKYADERGRTAFSACGGEARAQFEAIWHHLLELRR
jgi:cytochrome c2